MINLLLAANLGNIGVEQIIKNTNDNDLKITEMLCIAGVIAIFIICVTICLLSYMKKNKSTKRILEELLKTDKNITDHIKEKIAVSNVKDVSKELLYGSNSDFVKRVSDEVNRMNTEEKIKEVLNEMINKENSDIIKKIKDNLQTVNNNPQK